MPRRKKTVTFEENTINQTEVITETGDAPKETDDASKESDNNASAINVAEVERPIRRRRRRRSVDLPQTIDLSDFVTSVAVAIAPQHVTETETQLFKVGFSQIPANTSIGRYSPYLPLLIGAAGLVSVFLKILNERRRKAETAKKNSTPAPTVAEFWG